jgi:hypothetical protein
LLGDEIASRLCRLVDFLKRTCADAEPRRGRCIFSIHIDVDDLIVSHSENSIVKDLFDHLSRYLEIAGDQFSLAATRHPIKRQAVTGRDSFDASLSQFRCVKKDAIVRALAAAIISAWNIGP